MDKSLSKSKQITPEEIWRLNLLYIEDRADCYDELPARFLVSDADTACLILGHRVRHIDVLVDSGRKCTLVFPGGNPIVRMIATHRRLGQPVFVDGLELLSARKDFQSILRNAQAAFVSVEK